MAWRFSPAHTHERIRQTCSVDNTFDVQLLREMALGMQSRRASSHAVERYMSLLFLDDELLEYSDENAYIRWYAAAMFDDLVPVSSVQNALALTYAMPFAGWSEESASRLRSGDPLFTMAYNFSDPLADQLHEVVSPSSGGWLSPVAAAALARRLRATRTKIIASASSVPIAGENEYAKQMLIEESIESALAMLDLVQGSEYALRILWDI